MIFGYFGWGSASFYMFLNRTWGIMDNYILVCIPLFIFMASVLAAAGLIEELFDVVYQILGGLKGGLATAISAKLILKTMAKGNTKNSSSQTKGMPMTVIRPEGRNRFHRFFTMSTPRQRLAAS